MLQLESMLIFVREELFGGFELLLEAMRASNFDRTYVSILPKYL